MTSVAPLVGRIIGQCGGRKYCLSAHRTAAAPKAIGHDRSGLTLDDLAGKQPELMGGRGSDRKSGAEPRKKKKKKKYDALGSCLPAMWRSHARPRYHARGHPKPPKQARRRRDRLTCCPHGAPRPSSGTRRPHRAVTGAGAARTNRNEKRKI